MRSTLYLLGAVLSIVSAADPVPNVLMNYEEASATYILNPTTSQRTLQTRQTTLVSADFNTKLVNVTYAIHKSMIRDTSYNYTTGVSVFDNCH